MACSCSHWWHAPFYFSMALVLALFAISSSPPPPPPPRPPSTTTISLNATAALRSHGFSIIATLLQLSPDLFLSTTPTNSTPTTPNTSTTTTTVFAVADAAVSNLSAPPWAVKLLLQYHTLPHSKFSLHQLLLLPQNSCLPTSLPFKNLAVTKSDPENRLLEINGVRVSHPDLFLDDSVSIHGVLAPFMDLNRVDIQSGLDFIRPLPCNLFINRTGTGPDPTRKPDYADMWVRVIRVLSSNRFVSFAIGLNSVLDGILADYPYLGRVTVFAPPDFTFVGSSDPFLDREVRYHVLPQKYSFSDLASLPEKALLTTLLKGEVLEITECVNKSQLLAINGVEVASPDVFSTERFVVHGISRAFEFSNHANTS